MVGSTTGAALLVVASPVCAAVLLWASAGVEADGVSAARVPHVANKERGRGCTNGRCEFGGLEPARSSAALVSSRSSSQAMAASPASADTGDCERSVSAVLCSLSLAEDAFVATSGTVASVLTVAEEVGAICVRIKVATALHSSP